MKRVAEIMHIVEDMRDEFISSALHPDDETLGVLWMCGVRNQQYFELGNLIFMTFEYDGSDFKEDMEKMTDFLRKRGHLIEKRRRDVAPEERDNTNWWAPVKKLGTLLSEKPSILVSDPLIVNDYREMLDGYTHDSHFSYDISFDEDDWSETRF